MRFQSVDDIPTPAEAHIYDHNGPATSELVGASKLFCLGRTLSF